MEGLRIEPLGASIGHGVRAARAAGMEAWGFAGGGHADADLPRRLRAAGATQVFSSFAEASAFLGQP